MVHSFLQGVFITIIAIMVIGLIAPAFYISDKKSDKLLSRFVIPLDKGDDAKLSFTINHLESLLQQPYIAANNIALVAYDNGVQLYAGKNKYQVRLQQLLAKGVQFYACENSLAAMRKSAQQQTPLHEGIITVADGRKFVEELMEQGYTNNFA